MKKIVKKAFWVTLLVIFGLITILCIITMIASIECGFSNNGGSPGQFGSSESQIALMLVQHFPWLKSPITCVLSMACGIGTGSIAESIKDQML